MKHLEEKVIRKTDTSWNYNAGGGRKLNGNPGRECVRASTAFKMVQVTFLLSECMLHGYKVRSAASERAS